jgi:GWxTD domain-containing protein
VVAIALLPSAALAQRLNLDDYEEVDLDSIEQRHQDWFNKEVYWILTETEREVFVRLQTSEQRDTFIEEFWKQRDPTPGTPRNEYYEEYQRRLAHVNKFFGRGTSREGWQTDRGRTYLLLGPPQYTSSVPNDMITHPIEVWFYAGAVELGLPPFHYVMFYQRYGSGEFRMYSPLSDGPERLMNPAGMRAVEDMKQSRQRTPGFAPTGFRNPDIEYIYYLLRDIDIDVASAAISLFPSDAGLEFVQPLRSEMLIADIQAVPERLMPDTTYAYNILTGVTDSDVRFETLDIEAVATPLIDIDGQPFIHFAAQTPGDNLNLGEYEEDYFFSFDAGGSVTTPEFQVLQNFEANMSGELDTEAARRFRDTDFLYFDMIPTVPGKQNFDLMIENKVARTFGRAEFELDVPHARPDQLTLLGPVLGQAVQERPDFDAFADRFAFQYRGQAMVPSATKRFARGAPIVVMAQILLPAGHDRPLEMQLQVSRADGAVVQEARQAVDLDLADEYGVITPILTLPSDEMSPGDYRIRISLTDEPTGAGTAEVEIFEPAGTRVLPFINAQPAPPPTDVETYVERARQYAVLDEMEEALALLRDARERDPNNGQVMQAYVETLDAAGEYEELIEFVSPVVARNPRATDGMLMLAKAHASLGEHYDAIRYYERARIALGEDTTEILNSLASEYAADGNVAKAREILARSLELDEEQPEIRRMLDQLAGTAPPEPAQR